MTPYVNTAMWARTSINRAVGCCIPCIPTGCLEGHWDMADLCSITKDACNRVSKICDQTANNNDMVQCTGGSQPLWIDNDRNCKDIVDFAACRFVTVCFTSISQPYSIYGTAIVPDNAAGDNLGFLFGITGSSGFRYRSNDDSYRLNTGSDLTAGGVTQNVWRFFEAIADNTSSEWHVGDCCCASGTSGSAAITGLSMMRSGCGNTKGSEKFGELLLYSRELCACDKSDVKLFLEDKWAV